MIYRPEVYDTRTNAWARPIQARKDAYATQQAAANVLWRASRETQVGIIGGYRLEARSHRAARPAYVTVTFE